jgi:4-coumarate--CoA ligase
MNSTYFVGPGWVPPADDLSVPQVFLDGTFRHVSAPVERPDIPCMIEETTGRRVYMNEVCR